MSLASTVPPQTTVNTTAMPNLSPHIIPIITVDAPYDPILPSENIPLPSLPADITTLNEPYLPPTYSHFTPLDTSTLPSTQSSDTSTLSSTQYSDKPLSEPVTVDSQGSFLVTI